MTEKCKLDTLADRSKWAELHESFRQRMPEFLCNLPVAILLDVPEFFSDFRCAKKNYIR
jgi:hypothetical protein